MLGIRIEDKNGVGIFRSDYAGHLSMSMTQTIDTIGDRTPIPHPTEERLPGYTYEGEDFHRLFIKHKHDVKPIDESMVFIWHLDFFHANLRLTKQFISELRDKQFRIKVVSVKKVLAISSSQIVAHRRKVKCVSVVKEPYDFYKFIK